MILCVTLYVGGALLGFDAYDTVCISAHWVVQRGQGTPHICVLSESNGSELSNPTRFVLLTKLLINENSVENPTKWRRQVGENIEFLPPPSPAAASRFAKAMSEHRGPCNTQTKPC